MRSGFILEFVTKKMSNSYKIYFEIIRALIVYKVNETPEIKSSVFNDPQRTVFLMNKILQMG